MASPNRESRGFWGWPESTQSWGLGLSSPWVVLYASPGSVLLQGWVFEEVRGRCLVPAQCSLKHTVCLLWAVGCGRQCPSPEHTQDHLHSHQDSCPVTRDGFMDLTLEGGWELSRLNCLRTGENPL